MCGVFGPIGQLHWGDVCLPGLGYKVSLLVGESTYYVFPNSVTNIDV